MSTNKLLAEAAIYSTPKHAGAPVLAGYHCVNLENGNVVRVSPVGIKAVGEEVVGLKPGLRLATRADFDPHGYAAAVEAQQVASVDPEAKAKADAAEYARQLAALPADAPQRRAAKKGT